LKAQLGDLNERYSVQYFWIGTANVHTVV